MDNQAINNIKSLGIDMIKKAGSGHPGIVLGAAPIIYTLFTKHLVINHNDPSWINRDRFVLSAGHGSALLYSMLYMIGSLTLDDLKNFRQLDSITPGHPEYGVTPLVDATTGPLGQGIATAVGLALGAKVLDDRFTLNPNKSIFGSKKEHLFDYHVYALCGDGDLMEGISYESASLAGTLNLNNLIVLYDSNKITLDGETNKSFTEDVCKRFEAMNWNTIIVKNGEDIKAIDKAIEKAKNSNKPTLIEIRTVIGNGSVNQGTNIVHGKVLENSDIASLKASYNFPNEEFYIVPNISNFIINQMTERNRLLYDNWSKKYRTYLETKQNNDPSCFEFLHRRDKEVDLLKEQFNFESDLKEEIRQTNKKIMKRISMIEPNFLGGSADLFSSVLNYIDDAQDISSANYNGKNIWFGIREHAMGAILNGLALTNFKVYGSTFLSFADYQKPAMRLSCLMNLPVTYIFSHDSITIGSDGPTHQPVEQLSMLRNIPNNYVYRPADANELVGSWDCILKTKNHPSSLIISKNESLISNNSKAEFVSKGAYIYKREREKLHAVIIATGTEVALANRIVDSLYNECKLDIRVVSMPCNKLFEEQSAAYKESILPKGVRTFVIEYGVSADWYKYVYNDNYLFNVNDFGKSASKEELLKNMQLDAATIKEKIKQLLL